MISILVRLHKDNLSVMVTKSSHPERTKVMSLHDNATKWPDSCLHKAQDPVSIAVRVFFLNIRVVGEYVNG